jgi:hypothetical protein
MAGRSFVGRAAQLADLDRALVDAASGRGELVLLVGEPGIGKTRLAVEVARRAPEHAVAVAWATCPESGAPAFWPWTQVLRSLIDAGCPAGDLGAGAVLLDPAAAPTAGNDPELARFLLFDAVETALRSAARKQPWLVVLDDLHWADGASLLLLAFVAARLVTSPVLVLGTCRDAPDRDIRAPGPLHDLVRHGRRLALGGLSVSEVAELVTDLTGRAAVDATVGALHARTSGNPLLATELVRAATVQDGRIEDAAVPGSVRGIVGRRLDPLTEAARRTLTTAAVLGSAFRLGVLATVAQLPRSEVQEALDEAVGAKLVREAGADRYEFSHALVRDALYSGLGTAGQVRLHERTADALVQLAGTGAHVDPAELAHHFALAAPAGRATEAIAHVRAAAERATAILAYEEAARGYATALSLLELAPRAADEDELRLLLADARLAAGDLPAAREAYLAAATQARAAGHPDRLAQAALGLGGGPIGFEVAPFDREQVALLEEALAALPAQAPERAWLLARLSVALSMDAPVQRRLALAEQAVELARAAGDNATLAYALATRCDAVAGPEDAERREADAAEIVQLASERRDVRMELLGRRLRLVALLETGDMVGADAEIGAYERAVEAVRQPFYAWYVPLWRGMRAAAAGRIDDAERWLATTNATGSGSANARLLALVQRMFLLIDTGHSAEMVDVGEAVRDAIGNTGTVHEVGIALSRAVAGDTGTARQRLDALGIDRLSAVPRDSEWIAMLTELADLVAVLGHHPVAAWAYDALLPHRRRYAVEGIGAYWHGSVERPLGLLAAALGRAAESRGHFEAALAAHRKAGAPLLVARTLRDGGIALDDRVLLTEALATYRALGIDRRVSELERMLGSGHAAGGPTAGPGTDRATFRRAGEVWTLTWRARTALVKDSRGLRDLAQLLARPGQEIAVLDLAGVRGADLGEVTDAAARSAYKARLVELNAELAEADADGDVERSARAVAERDALVAHLTAAYGLGGRARRAGDPAERARSTVTARIRDALRHIEDAHPELGHHLRHSVRTGMFCAYQPEDPVSWQL